MSYLKKKMSIVKTKQKIRMKMQAQEIFGGKWRQTKARRSLFIGRYYKIPP